MERYEGKKVVVIGGTSGMGLANVTEAMYDEMFMRRLHGKGRHLPAQRVARVPVLTRPAPEISDTSHVARKT